MSEIIRVVDECLPRDAYDNLAKFVASLPMEYGSRSNTQDDPHGHWMAIFLKAGAHNLADVSSILEETPQYEALHVAWTFLQSNYLADSVLLRCYLNGYTYGTEGYFHTDSYRADEHTTIIFMNESWQPDWAGETVFLDENADIGRAVLPRKNRAIMFPANVPHAGRSVSRKCVVLRKTLIYKSRKKRSANFEKLSAFLRQNGASRHNHQSGSLHDHLVRTFAMLEARGCAAEVCFGGGLHALYGTNLFTQSTMTYAARPAIAAAFGERAEQLAYLFSILNRPKTLNGPVELRPDAAAVELRDGRTITMPRTTFDDLRNIECANLRDQKALAGHESLSRFWNETASNPSQAAAVYIRG